jgi:Mg-chelatase subunit ChlD
MHRLRTRLALLATLASAAALAAPPEDAQRIDERPVLDVVFALDTTGSMGGLLEGAKQKVWSIASRMASGKPTPRVRVGLVAYRDQGDEYVTRVFPLSDDLDAVYRNLKAFTANGGGDGPEAVQQALADAVDKMAWSDARRAAKMIFVVGDAPAHVQDRQALLAASRRAIARGIVVNTLRCGGDSDAETQFREVARLADGHFDTIQQGGGVVAVATPFDADLSRLNGALMDTAIYAGKKEAQVAGESRRLEAKSLAAPAAADRVSFLSKGGGSASGASAVGALDLTTAPAKAASLREDELPAELQALPKEERVAYAQKQQVRRAQLEQEIAAVSAKRDGYLATHAKDKADSFDGRVFEAVKAGAARAGVAY